MQSHSFPGLLTIEHLAGMTRLELAASALTGQRSNQLSYTPTGASQRIRIQDLSAKASALYPVQLCNARHMMELSITRKTMDCQDGLDPSHRGDIRS